MTQENPVSDLWGTRPADLSVVAVETDDGLRYSWRDLDRASAMLANLLQSLDLPEGSRIFAQVEKSVEAVLLHQAAHWAGFVFLSRSLDVQRDEIEHLISATPPNVVVCSGGNFGWISKVAFKAGTPHVFTLNHDRTGSLLQRAAHHSDLFSAGHCA